MSAVRPHAANGTVKVSGGPGCRELGASTRPRGVDDQCAARYEIDAGSALAPDHHAF
ncbi:MAG TPA: hypothetical protein VK595_07290 [Vicinamibacterales bacterium]|nr:hypothetical protein [Vicinamibacterales bacterium]